MKKILIVLIFSFSFICSIFLSVKAQSYKVNEIVENEFEMSKKFSINLPEGKWVIVEKSTMYFHGIRTKTYSLLRLENKKVVVRKQLDMSETDIERLVEAITIRLQEYLDIKDDKILNTSVTAAVKELLENK